MENILFLWHTLYLQIDIYSQFIYKLIIEYSNLITKSVLSFVLNCVWIYVLIYISIISIGTKRIILFHN